MYIQECNEDQVVKVSRNIIKISQIPVIIGIINGISKKKNRDAVEISLINPLSTLKIQLYIHHQIEIGDLVIIRNSKILKDQKYMLDQESSIEIGHRFLKDGIICFKDKMTDLNLKVVVEDLIKWGSRQEWIQKLVECKQPDRFSLKNVKVNGTFLKLFVINALDEKIDITDMKNKAEFIKCDTCLKCNFRNEDYCVYCRCSLDKNKRVYLPDIRMDLNTFQGLLELRLWKWFDQWFPEIMQYPQVEIEGVYRRFVRVLDTIKGLKQVSMVLQQVGKVYYLIDVD